MAILGQAIARHISSLHGLYFVELPEALSAEMISLVQQANSLEAPRRALLVTSGAAPAALSSVTIGWREILAWRTDEDRVFVWQRGLHEPDSSFQSVVRPFISRRFPGAGGGECSLSQLIRACVRELWERRGWLPNGDVFDAFLLTTEWVNDVLCGFFERAGNTPGEHWSDRYLIHLASMLENLDAELTAFTGLLVPRHAWEVVRLSGLPLPSALVEDSNPFLQPPTPLPAARVREFTDLWTEVVQRFLLRDGGVAELLAALDAEAVGVKKISPWRGLDWRSVQSLTLDTPAPMVGAMVFASLPSPTILSDTIPNTSAPTRPSWWGVTTDNLASARALLRNSSPLIPDSMRPGFIPLWVGTSAPYILDTRAGTVSHSHTPTRWRARISLQDLGLRYKENWQSLRLSETEPPGGVDGDAWVNPHAVTLEMRNCVFTHPRVTATAGDQLRILFDVTIEYTVGRDRVSHDVSGSWSLSRKLKVKIPVRLRLAGNWDVDRTVEVEIRVFIPSPFAPTLFITNGTTLEAAGPDNEDIYSAENSGSTQWMATTPTILLSEEGQYGVLLYDGSLEPWSPTFRSLAIPSVGPATLPVPASALFPETTHHLDDNVVVSDASPAHSGDVAVFQVKERSTNVSSGILSAVRGLPSGRRAPAGTARNTVLGQYQDNVTPTICRASGSSLDSLYQIVIGASDKSLNWVAHPGGPEPLMLLEKPTGFVLPGITNGPSAQLVGCPEWGAFMAAMGQACVSLGLMPGAEDMWLSGVDPSTVPATVLSALLAAHRSLVAAANTHADRFWASYPFSVFVVEGAAGVDFGELKAVFLSPLHPVRLAWGFAAASVARRSGVDHGLLGLLEGWNFPAAGAALNPAGEIRGLVAVPIDPGPEQDFIGWSALAVLGAGGTADLPLVGAGKTLPWGGRSGINARVIERSLTDYLTAHPHINSFEVDVRSVGGSPRSAEIDDTLLGLLGNAELDKVSELGGGTKVWDSLDRHGKPPTRDVLFSKRRSQEAERSFEWRVYPAAQSPQNTDVAFVENATVHLAVGAGQAYGVVGLLPLRRFLTPDLTGTQLDQNFLPRDGEDVLGLASLLRILESPEGADKLHIRATPQMHALGIGRNAQWEVLGTFNIDPSLLATLIAKAPTGGGKRLLWEWRPSWMVAERATAGLARRPYYVIARAPVALTRALHARQAISKDNAEELLSVLGQRGIGLAALNAEGATQESAAAGFFYAIQLLRPSTGTTPFDALEAAQRPLVYGVLLLDPVEPMLQGLAGRPLNRRADMLAVGVSRRADGVLRLCIVPVEVKHHGMPATPEKLPDTTSSELRRAREQLTQTVAILREMITSIGGTSDDEAGLRYLKRLALATLVDLAMSFSPAPPSSATRSAILTDLLGGPLVIGVGDPLLLWFAPGSILHTGQPHVIDPHSPCTIETLTVREVYMDPSAVPGLWWNGGATGAAETLTRATVDGIVRSSFAKCATEATAVGPNRDDILNFLRVPPSLDSLASTATSPELLAEGPSAAPALHPAPDLVASPAGDSPSVPPVVVPRSNVELAPTPSSMTIGASTGVSPTVEPPRPPEAPGIARPRAVLGWSELSNRWSLVGRMTPGDEPVAIDLDHPKTIGIFGFMGSGKSYLLGNLIESALMEIPGVNRLPAPLAVVIFNYRRNSSDRFELSSLAVPNDAADDVDRLAEEYGATPQGASNFRVLCLPGELRSGRLQEYGSLAATELFFSPARLDVEDWELLMGEPGSEAVFARTIRNVLVDLRSTGDITLERLEQDVSNRLTGQSRAAARLRFEFVRRYMSEDRGANFADLLQPGRALIIDLRQPLFNKEDALRFFLICANQVSRVQGRFNKVIVFDEAHEYMSEAFGDRMESRIRQMRHEGTSYVFATQDTGSIPMGISRFLTTRFVFNLGTRENVTDLEQAAPEFRGLPLLSMRPGHCLVQASDSAHSLFARPREIRVRPRVTKHGGASRIFPGT